MTAASVAYQHPGAQYLTEHDAIRCMEMPRLAQEAMLLSKRSHACQVLGVSLSSDGLDFVTRGDVPCWFEGVLATINEYLRLPDNWDSYGAGKINPRWAAQTLVVALEVARSDTPPPSFVPTRTGGIQFEWHENDIDLEVEVVSQSEFSVYYLNERTSEEREFSIRRQDFRELGRLVAELSDPNLRISRRG